MAKHPSIIIGEYLHSERIKKGISIDRLAKKSQLSSSQISVIERGHNPQTGKYNNITLTSLELIGNGLSLSVYDILENSGYYYSFHDTIKQSERHLSTYMQSLLNKKYSALNSINQEKALLYIENLLETQGNSS